MDEDKIFEQLEAELKAFATKFSVTRLKLSTVNFDREFKRGQDGDLRLVSTKAVIRVLGKTTKVPIGADQEYKTFEEAFEATKRYWSEYYRGVRAKRTDQERLAEAKRQKRYRERRKKEALGLTRQQ